MKYFFPILCAALNLIENFETKACVRDSDFSVRIDNHYDELLLSAEIQSPDFLYLNQRTISVEALSSMHSNYPINILDLAYTTQAPIILDTQSLIIFNSSDNWNISITQQFMHPIIPYYAKLVVSSYIILYNSTSIAFFEYNRVYPRFVTEYVSDTNFTCVCLFKESAVIAYFDKIIVLDIEDAALGAFRVGQAIHPEQINLTEFRVREMIVNEDFLYILDDELGLCELSLNPLQLLRVFNVFGEKLAIFKESISIDGKYILNLATYQLTSYNISEKCEYLSIDTEFLYCGFDDQIIYYSRLLPIQKQLTTRPIKAMKSHNSVLYTAFKDTVQVEKVSLSPLIASGKVPNEIKDYKVNIKVWSTNDQSDNAEFTLRILYNLTDVILFIVISLFVVFLCVACVLFLFNLCKKKEEPEVKNYNTPIRQDSINMPDTIRNPFSDRRLVERTQ